MVAVAMAHSNWRNVIAIVVYALRLVARFK